MDLFLFSNFPYALPIMETVGEIRYYRTIKRSEPGAVILDADRDGRVDPGEGVVVPRCGERFLVVATANSLELSDWRQGLRISPSATRLPYGVALHRNETVESVKAKIRGLGHFGLLELASTGGQESIHPRDIRSHEVFRTLAERIPDELPHVLKRRSLTVLYPASGSHVAPLATFFELIDRDEIDRGEILLTEIEPFTLGRLRGNLEALERNGILDHFKIVEREGSDSSYKGLIEVVYHGRPITIFLAVNRTGENFYAPEFLAGADVVVLHDADAGYEGGASLISSLLWDRQLCEKPQLVLLENEMDVPAGHAVGTNLNFLNHARIPGGYGHRNSPDYWTYPDETGCPYEQSALILRPDQPLLQALNRSDLELVIRFAALSREGHYEECRQITDGLNEWMSNLARGRKEEVRKQLEFQIIRGEELETLVRTIEGWFDLPDDILPQGKKEMLALQLLFYLTSFAERLPSILPGYQESLQNGPAVMADFWERHPTLFGRAKEVLITYSRRLTKISRKDRRSMKRFLEGKPLPPQPRWTGWSWEKPLSDLIKELATRPASGRT